MGVRVVIGGGSGGHWWGVRVVIGGGVRVWLGSAAAWLVTAPLLRPTFSRGDLPSGAASDALPACLSERRFSPGGNAKNIIKSTPDEFANHH